jgi:hypothetical protein
MWKAKLINVVEDVSKRTDGLIMTVELFDDATTRKTTKEYLLWVNDFTTIDLASIKAVVQKDLDTLNKVDQVKTALQAKIGLVI